MGEGRRCCLSLIISAGTLLNSMPVAPVDTISDVRLAIVQAVGLRSSQRLRCSACLLPAWQADVELVRSHIRSDPCSRGALPLKIGLPIQTSSLHLELGMPCAQTGCKLAIELTLNGCASARTTTRRNASQRTRRGLGWRHDGATERHLCRQHGRFVLDGPRGGNLRARRTVLSGSELSSPRIALLLRHSPSQVARNLGGSRGRQRNQR